MGFLNGFQVIIALLIFSTCFEILTGNFVNRVEFSMEVRDVISYVDVACGRGTTYNTLQMDWWCFSQEPSYLVKNVYYCALRNGMPSKPWAGIHPIGSAPFHSTQLTSQPKCGWTARRYHYSGDACWSFLFYVYGTIDTFVERVTTLVRLDLEGSTESTDKLIHEYSNYCPSFLIWYSIRFCPLAETITDYKNVLVALFCDRKWTDDVHPNIP